MSLGNKPGFTQYDNASPHHSITIEREVQEALSDEELIEKASDLHRKCRDLVERKINTDLKQIQSKEVTS